jgi:hypothetical protein
VGNPTSNGAAATPAGGGPFVGMRRRVHRAVTGEVVCDECGTVFDGEFCPTCRQRLRRRAGLEAVIDTVGGDRVWVTVERADHHDGGGWWPTDRHPYDEDPGEGEPGGWPW